MESGPVAGGFLILLMTCFMFYGEKGVKVWSMGQESLRLIMRLSDCKGFKWLMFAQWSMSMFACFLYVGMLLLAPIAACDVVTPVFD